MKDAFAVIGTCLLTHNFLSSYLKGATITELHEQIATEMPFPTVTICDRSALFKDSLYQWINCSER